LITKDKVGKKEKSVIQCKRTKNSVGISVIRELAGTISSLKATKGILICTSLFTPQAELFSKANPRIELINFQKLTYLLNMHLGTNWPTRLDRLLRE
jgi:restriction system protein